jgi:alpha-tubulin suppressor-like RCC1 family protein
VTSPAQVTSATDWKTVAAGGSHTCAVRGKLYCWGSDGDGQVGNGAPTGDVTSPQQV